MRTLLLIAGLMIGLAAAADVFRWVDENGQVNYSDRPHDGAEEIELMDVQTFSAPATSRRPPDSSGSESESEPSFRYELLEITRPAQEEVLWNIEGQLDVSAQLVPRLQRGHSLRWILDGQAVKGLSPSSTRVRLSEVYRGSHNLSVEVLDRSGTNVIRSQPVSFSVQQTSIQNPNNPNVPRPTPLPRPRPR
jgi:hypothetical protein